MKIVIFGLSITSSWGNGHATTFRSLARALRWLGHSIVFFEKDQEWYASNRDMPEPPFCKTIIYQEWAQIASRARRELSDAEVAIVGSYFPDSARAISEVFDSGVAVKAFYDIDTPITIAALRSGEADYLRPEQVPGFDIYFSFTGGPILQELQSRFGARMAVPLYCSFDPDRYHRVEPHPEYISDFSYMGTYAPDRQSKIEEFFCEPARRLPQLKFSLAGPQYPEEILWPDNVARITHLEPRFHAAFYSSSRFTLNVTRREMILAGYSPSVRLFEAAACGATIVSDAWLGLETFLTPGDEILVPRSVEDVVTYLNEMDETEVNRIGLMARDRVMQEHTALHRAAEFEHHVAVAAAKSVRSCLSSVPPDMQKLSTVNS